MVEVTHIETERLCIHHGTAQFDCGQSEWNLKLTDYQDRFEKGEKVLGFVAPGDNHEVMGYVILREDVLRMRPSGKRLRCFMVPAMAVDKRHKREGLFAALTERALNACAVRQRIAKAGGETPYQGLVCMPLGNKALERWLVGWAHFKPLGNSGLYWLPLGNTESDME